MELPSGRQLVLRYGEQRAVVTEVGAGLRAYAVGGVDVIDGYAEDEMCGGARGQLLMPWPNRVRDGRWEWEGASLQLALTEVAKSTAIHGLTRWLTWDVLTQDRASVRLGCRLPAQPGWPFRLGLQAHYVLDETGLTVTMTALNEGVAAAPFAAGVHPYLAAGGGLVDDCTLLLPARTWLPVDSRGTPVEALTVGGTERDFLVPRVIGSLVLDEAFTDLVPEAGLVTVALTRPDGTTASLWAGAGFDHVQLFSGDTLPAPRRRRGLAVEPMTAPPNALQSGHGLRVLQPGESLDLAWGLRLS